MPPKPWQNGSAAASAPGASGSEPKPWEAQTTVAAGDSIPSGASAVDRPWDRSNGQAVLAGSGVSQPAGYGGSTYSSGYALASPPAFASPYSGMTSYGGMNTYMGGGGMYSPSGYGSMGSGAYGSYGNYTGGLYGGYGGYGAMRSPYGAGSVYGSPYGAPGYGSPYSGATYGAYGAGTYGSGMGSAGQPLYGQGPGPGGPGSQGQVLGHARTRWQIFMESVQGVMHFFGRVSFLMDENAHAVHFFVTALLQMLDRASFLWGEIARFVLRLLGYKRPLGDVQKGAMPDMPRLTGPPDSSHLGDGGRLEAAWHGPATPTT